ncbi:MAG: DUF6134 family protein [Ferruginibacter sp.]
MLPLLIILYIKKHKTRLAVLFRSFIINKIVIIKLVTLIVSFLLIAKLAFTQTKSYHYDISKGGSSIGEAVLTNTISGTANTVSLVSNIKYRFMFLFTATSKEEVVFVNGIMTFSSLYREQNGNKKIAQKTTRASAKYVVAVNNEKEKELNIATINYQTLCLYTTEPVIYQQVYIDKFQQLVAIQKISAHQYKVVFPDGNYNEYYYQDGVCQMVKVHQSLYNVQIELKKIF